MPTIRRLRQMFDVENSAQMKPHDYFPIDRASANAVRPAFRIVGAIITLGLAVLFTLDALPLLTSNSVAMSPCAKDSTRYRVWCEVGSWMISLLPVSMHGPVLSMVGFIIASAFLVATWLLLRPLLRRLVDHSKRSSRIN